MSARGFEGRGGGGGYMEVAAAATVGCGVAGGLGSHDEMGAIASSMYEEAIVGGRSGLDPEKEAERSICTVVATQLLQQHLEKEAG